MWLAITAYFFAAALAAAGVWLLIDRSPGVSRVGDDDHQDVPEEGQSLPVRMAARRRSMSLTTRTVTGLCMVLVAYHGAAYVSPDSWFGLKVPVGRAWLLGIGVVAALVLSRVADRLERDG